MAQAKTLTTNELEQVLRYISSTTYAQRNRAMLLMGYWAGLRVKEIAQLKMGDVLNDDGTIKSEIRLSAQQTKGNDGRTFPYSIHLSVWAGHPIPYASTSFGFTRKQVLQVLVATVVVGNSLRPWQIRASLCVSWLAWRGIRALQ